MTSDTQAIIRARPVGSPRAEHPATKEPQPDHHQTWSPPGQTPFPPNPQFNQQPQQPALKTSLEILHFIEEYISARGFSPSVRDIQDATNIRSTSTIRRHLDILTDTGYITRTKQTARSIVLTNCPHHAT